MLDRGVVKRLVGAPALGAVTLSVVCASRNAEHCIASLIRSYRREHVVGSELIVIDGASTDGTWQILESSTDAIRFAVSEGDSGIYDAWNRALPLCSGKYVAFIGADDRLARGSIGALVEACKLAVDCPHIVAGFNVLTRRSVPVALIGGLYDSVRLENRMIIAHVMCAHDLSWLKSAGGFDSSFQSSGDYELLLRERPLLRVQVIQEILAYVEDGGRSRVTLRPYSENFRARRINGVPLWRCGLLFCRAIVGRAVRRALGR